jgi:hypothetical protein
MIPPVPPNYGFSLLAIPVWRWEETPASPSDAAPAQDIAGGPCNANAGESASPAASAPDKRLVFVGYEWRSAVEWRLFPDAPWDHGFDDQLGDIREGSLRREREQQDQQNALTRLQSNEARASLHRDTKNPADVADTPAPPSRTSTD